MGRIKDFFHLLSYSQYALVAISMYYYAYFIIALPKGQIDWNDLNKALVFFGISISMSTLQDTTKTQNKFSRKIWEHPKKGKAMIFMIAILALIAITAGIIGTLKSTEDIHKEISLGILVLGIGMIGMLKSGIEMFENHRLDKK